MQRLTSIEEYAVIDPSDLELDAIRAALAPLGDYVSSIGMDRPLSDYRREEVLRLVEVVIDAYQARMLEEHEEMAERERSFFEQRLAAQAQSAAGSNTRIPF
jgi:hypothetical protein